MRLLLDYITDKYNVYRLASSPIPMLANEVRRWNPKGFYLLPHVYVLLFDRRMSVEPRPGLFLKSTRSSGYEIYYHSPGIPRMSYDICIMDCGAKDPTRFIVMDRQDGPKQLEVEENIPIIWDISDFFWVTNGIGPEMTVGLWCAMNIRTTWGVLNGIRHNVLPIR